MKATRISVLVACFLVTGACRAPDYPAVDPGEVDVLLAKSLAAEKMLQAGLVELEKRELNAGSRTFALSELVDSKTLPSIKSRAAAHAAVWEDFIGLQRNKWVDLRAAVREAKFTPWFAAEFSARMNSEYATQMSNLDLFSNANRREYDAAMKLMTFVEKHLGKIELMNGTLIMSDSAESNELGLLLQSFAEAQRETIAANIAAVRRKESLVTYLRCAKIGRTPDTTPNFNSCVTQK